MATLTYPGHFYYYPDTGKFAPGFWQLRLGPYLGTILLRDEIEWSLRYGTKLTIGQGATLHYCETVQDIATAQQAVFEAIAAHLEGGRWNGHLDVEGNRNS